MIWAVKGLMLLISRSTM